MHENTETDLGCKSLDNGQRRKISWFGKQEWKVIGQILLCITFIKSCSNFQPQKEKKKLI